MSASPSGQPRRLSPLFQILGWIVAWGWALLTIIGGVGLLILQGPWPPTNGWFALFSGLAACPLTAWMLRKYRGISFPGWARFVVALLFIVAGRIALKIEGRAPFTPDFSNAKF